MSKPETIKIDEVEYVRKDSIPPTANYTPSTKTGPWEVGKSYFVRTVTMFIHGQLIDVTDKELVFSQAAWIADTGRFHQFITGVAEPNEVEPFPQDAAVIVNRSAVVDACQRPGKFGKQK